MRNPLLPAAGCLLLIFTLNCPAQTAAPTGDAQPYSPIPGFDPAAMDKSADPCIDFYQYACGNFAKLHPIPGDLPVFDQFVNLFEFNTQALHQIVEKAAAAHAATGTNEQKIGDYYATCMDTQAIDKARTWPLQPVLDRIDALPLREASCRPLVATSTAWRQTSSSTSARSRISKTRRHVIAHIDQAASGLPEKDYYLRTDAKSVDLRKQYVAHLAQRLTLSAIPTDQAAAEARRSWHSKPHSPTPPWATSRRRDPARTSTT